MQHPLTTMMERLTGPENRVCGHYNMAVLVDYEADDGPAKISLRNTSKGEVIVLVVPDMPAGYDDEYHFRTPADCSTFLRALVGTGANDLPEEIWALDIRNA